MLRFRSRVLIVATVGIALLGFAQMAEAQSQTGWTSQGQQLPAPRGLSFSLYNQTQAYDILNLNFAFPGIDPAMVPQLEVDNRTTTYHLKLDYWLAPYLNIFAIGGKVNGTTSIKLRDIDLGVPLQLNDLKVTYRGWIYGAGATLAAGWNKCFVTTTYQYTEADLDVATSSIRAEVIIPKIGLQLERGAVWVGAMHQDAEENHSGIFDMPLLGSIPYEVELGEEEPWSYMIGMAADLGKDYVLIMEGGFGSRNTVFASIERRF
jgi:hypothetical protein